MKLGNFTLNRFVSIMVKSVLNFGGHQINTCNGKVGEDVEYSKHKSQQSPSVDANPSFSSLT